MKLPGFKVSKRLAFATLIVCAVVVLALAGKIGGDAALVAILGVGAALGVYKGAARGRGGSRGKVRVAETSDEDPRNGGSE